MTTPCNQPAEQPLEDCVSAMTAKEYDNCIKRLNEQALQSIQENDLSFADFELMFDITTFSDDFIKNVTEILANKPIRDCEPSAVDCFDLDIEEEASRYYDSPNVDLAAQEDLEDWFQSEEDWMQSEIDYFESTSLAEVKDSPSMFRTEIFVPSEPSSSAQQTKQRDCNGDTKSNPGMHLHQYRATANTMSVTNLRMHARARTDSLLLWEYPDHYIGRSNSKLAPPSTNGSGWATFQPKS